LEIIELLGYDSVSGEIQTETLYEFEEEGTDEQGRIQGELKKRAELHDRRKLLRAGIDERDG
jgi:pilus assembly protein CpaF